MTILKSCLLELLIHDLSITKRLPYNVTFLQAINELFKLLIDYTREQYFVDIDVELIFRLLLPSKSKNDPKFFLSHQLLKLLDTPKIVLKLESKR